MENQTTHFPWRRSRSWDFIRGYHWKFRPYLRSYLRFLLGPITLPLVLFSIFTRVQFGYWALSPEEWNYRHLQVIESQLHQELASFCQAAESHALREDPSTRDRVAQYFEEKATRVLSAYERFIQNHPQHLRSIASYCALLEKLGKASEARTAWTRLFEVLPSHPGLVHRIAEDDPSSDPLVAIPFYEIAVQTNPDNALYHFHLGNLYYLFRKETMDLHGWNLRTLLSKSLHEFRMAYEAERSNYEYAVAYAETIYGVNFLLHRNSWHEARMVWESCLEIDLPEAVKDHVHTQLVRLGSYLKDPLLALKHHSMILSPNQQALATQLLQRSFPETCATRLRL